MNRKILLSKTRGFCAGVSRAIQIVEIALKNYAHPIFIKHEIVHNTSVINDLQKKGVIFIEDIDSVPNGSVIIFSAHGVSKEIEEKAAKRNLIIIDATCPLVKKVHKEILIFEKKYKNIIIIGHNDHPEIHGVIGQITEKNVKLNIISSIQEVDDLLLKIDRNETLGYVTQTTLSVDDTKNIIKKLKEVFPNIQGPIISDICYATQNRQNAAKKLSNICDIIIIVGSKNSSNSKRLVEIVQNAKIEAYLIDSNEQIDIGWFYKKNMIGVIAGASVPESLIFNIVKYISNTINILEVEEIDFGIVENVTFNNLPSNLTNRI